MTDNLDHNIAALKHCITFQSGGMGIIVVITKMELPPQNN